MQKPLREEINDVVVKYLEHKFETGGTVDVAEMAHELAQSLIDMIMEQEGGQWETHAFVGESSFTAFLGELQHQRLA
jgi:DNA-binding protein Fis